MSGKFNINGDLLGGDMKSREKHEKEYQNHNQPKLRVGYAC